MNHVARHTLTTILLAVGLALLGCRDQSSSPSQPAPQPKLTMLAAGSDTWTRDTAYANLADTDLAVSAAIRLVRLAKLAPLCVPDVLTDDHIYRLTFVQFNEHLYALGLVVGSDRACLHAPILFRPEGVVEPVAVGPLEEATRLYLSADTERFPNVFVQPDRVSVLTEDGLTIAIILEPDPDVVFDLRVEDDLGRIVLLLADRPVEVSKYLWDPWESAFIGPAVNRLPDPPGGSFYIDLEGSRMLVPMGGEMPEPEPIKQTPPAQPPGDAGGLTAL